MIKKKIQQNKKAYNYFIKNLIIKLNIINHDKQKIDALQTTILTQREPHRRMFETKSK